MINKLALSAICLGGLIGASCVVVEDEGEFDVTWELDPGCAAGAAAQISATDIDTGAVFTDIYDCTDKFGRMSRLPLGRYDVSVDILTADLSVLLARSEVSQATLDFEGDLIQIDLPTFLADEGYFGFTWSMVDTGTVVNCADVFAESVQFEATLVNSTSAVRLELFDCDVGTAVTDPILVGDYSIFMDLLGENDIILASSSEVNAAIEFGNHYVVLQPAAGSITDATFEFTFE